MGGSVETCAANECRECCAFCDRLVHPSGCIASGCEYLYAYDDEHSGARYVGCLRSVFSVEIDLALLQEAERTRHGFGGVKMTGTPLPQCVSTVERAYHGEGEAFRCVNPGFFADRPAGRFELRDRLR